MPRRRDEEAEESKVEEDFLEVDKPVPGQSYCCISFVSPEKVLERKEKFLYHHYLQWRIQQYTNNFDEMMTDIVDNCEDNTVEISKVVQLKKKMKKMYQDDKVEFKDFKEKYEDFMFRENDNLSKTFDDENNFKTSVRGVKVRGVYDTYREAEVRAKVLQRQDQSFDVFVGQVGYWLPWDPESNKVENQEYMNDDLNKLVKGYKDNETKKDMFYQEQTRERKKDAGAVADRLRKKLEAKEKDEEKNKNDETSKDATENEKHKLSSSLDDMMNKPVDDVTADGPKIEEITDEQPKFEVGDSSAPEVTLDEAAQALQEDDPWMKRNLEKKAAEAEAGASSDAAEASSQST